MTKFEIIEDKVGKKSEESLHFWSLLNKRNNSANLLFGKIISYTLDGIEVTEVKKTFKYLKETFEKPVKSTNASYIQSYIIDIEDDKSEGKALATPNLTIPELAKKVLNGEVLRFSITPITIFESGNICEENEKRQNFVYSKEPRLGELKILQKTLKAWASVA